MTLEDEFGMQQGRTPDPVSINAMRIGQAVELTQRIETLLDGMGAYGSDVPERIASLGRILPQQIAGRVEYVERFRNRLLHDRWEPSESEFQGFLSQAGQVQTELAQLAQAPVQPVSERQHSPFPDHDAVVQVEGRAQSGRAQFIQRVGPDSSTSNAGLVMLWLFVAAIAAAAYVVYEFSWKQQSAPSEQAQPAVVEKAEPSPPAPVPPRSVADAPKPVPAPVSRRAAPEPESGREKVVPPDPAPVAPRQASAPADAPRNTGPAQQSSAVDPGPSTESARQVRAVELAPAVDEVALVDTELAERLQRQILEEIGRVQPVAKAPAREPPVSQRTIAAYAQKIRGHVVAHLVIPPGLSGNPEVVFRVRQLVDGHVTRIELLRSSGNAQLDIAVERAIRHASPLPVPEDPRIYSDVLDLTFRPLN